MQEALYKIQSVKINHDALILIDGRDNYLFDVPDLPRPKYIVRGDSLVPQIMAASVMAKVTRDRIMIDYEEVFL